MLHKFRVPTEQLYWDVNAAEFPFNSTKDIKPTLQVFGHDIAKDALTFAIECQSPGFNAYVRGLSGSGRKTLIKQVFTELKPQARQQKDYCYVHNFTHPNEPRLIILAGGYGKILKQMLSLFADYVANDLPKSFNSDSLNEQRKIVEEKTNKAVSEIYAPLETALGEKGLALANMNDGKQNRMVIAPVYEGRILSPEELNELVKKGEFSEESLAKLEELMPAFQAQLIEVSGQSNELIEKSFAEIRQLDSEFARAQLSGHLTAIKEKFDNESLNVYLTEIVDDFIENVLHNENATFNPTVLYGVNLLSPRYENEQAPVIFESSPSLTNLLGAVETEGKLPAYASISAGSLLKADGGFLVISVDDALAETGTWATIMQTIRSGKLSIAFEDKSQQRPAVIKPEPIPLDVKMILVGSHQRYYELNAYENGFAEHFKVLVDLDTELLRKAESYLQYAHVISKVVNEENLLHFNREAVAQMIEHGARLSSGREKISARFGRVMDTAREASYLAQKDKAQSVDKKHVIGAIRASKKRGYAPAKRFYEMLESGTIIIEISGERVGQINGLAVTQAGTVSYGFPARITTTIAPGKSGLIDIEGQADLSGQIHTKGVQILGGLLRHVLKLDRPLSFSASIAFEQSYGGIDGDSASGAEACCLLSALTQTPIKQSLSMTGAIDQFGQIQAIGGVNEKIEGFFDSCKFNTLTGNQGVIIPVANVADLMLRDDVVRACEAGEFHIYAVDHVLDALAILTGTASCKQALLSCTPYQNGSILATAVERASLLSEQSSS